MAIEIAGMTIDWRAGIIGLVALVLMYMALVLWRMRRLSELPTAEAPEAYNGPAVPPAAPRQAAGRQAAAYAATSRLETAEDGIDDPVALHPAAQAALQQAAFRHEPLPEPRYAESYAPAEPPAQPVSTQEISAAWNQAGHNGFPAGFQAAAAPAGLSDADEARLQRLEHTVQHLRHEVELLRNDLATMRQDVMQSVTQVRATQSVSPLYSDAMQMATLGHDAATIAERCGIARAEAELVLALVSNHKR